MLIKKSLGLALGLLAALVFGLKPTASHAQAAAGWVVAYSGGHGTVTCTDVNGNTTSSPVLFTNTNSGTPGLYTYGVEQSYYPPLSPTPSDVYATVEGGFTVTVTWAGPGPVPVAAYITVTTSYGGYSSTAPDDGYVAPASASYSYSWKSTSGQSSFVLTIPDPGAYVLDAHGSGPYVHISYSLATTVISGRALSTHPL